MLKKFLTGVLALATFSSFACWGTIENYDKNFIYAINNFVRTNLATITFPGTFTNGGNVSFPATVNVRISPLNTGNPITKAVLQYRIGDSGNYTTAVEIDNPKWDLNIATPRPVFGIDTIKIAQIPSAGTKVYIRLYLTDGIYETFDLASNDSELGAFTCYVVSTGRAVPQMTIGMNATVDMPNGGVQSVPLTTLQFMSKEMI